jgi:hypothetical protein
MTSSFEASSGYARKIWTYSRQYIHGSAYRPVTDFLIRARHEDGSNEYTGISTKAFLWYYSTTDPSQLMLPVPILSPSSFRDVHTQALASACRGSLVFLRGYPSPDWLAFLGHHYQIDPSYWKQHLEFLPKVGVAFPQERPLPSTTSCTFQLRVGSIGSWGRWWYPQHRLEDLRSSAATDMRNYCTALSSGRNWNQGKSIVRHFSIEQKVIVHLYNNTDPDRWTGIAFF